MALRSETQELIGATRWLFDFFTVWFVIAAVGAYRLLLVSATMVAAGGEDFTTELGLVTHLRLKIKAVNIWLRISKSGYS